MHNVSETYKRLVKTAGRKWVVEVKTNIELANDLIAIQKYTVADESKLVLTDRDILQNGLSIKDSVCPEGEITVGGIIPKELTLEIENSDGRFDSIPFQNAELEVKIGLVVKQKYDKTCEIEWVNKGIFTVSEVAERENSLALTAYDDIIKLDKDFDLGDYSASTLTMNSIVQKAEEICSVSIDKTAINTYMQNYQLGIDEDYLNGDYTYRDVIGFIAQILGCYAQVDDTGQICFQWFPFSGQGLKKVDSYTNLSKNVFNFTGVLLYTEGGGRVTSSMFNFADAYPLKIPLNPLMQGTDSAYARQRIATVIYEKIKDTTFAVFESNILSDPSLQAGDIVEIQDKQGNTIELPITNLTYTIDNKEYIACGV